MKQYPTVAVIMLNWNTPKMTIDCVHSVLGSDYPNFQIHLTDNGSRDGSCNDIGQEFGKKIHLYHLDKNRGYVGGMNYCLAQADMHNPDYFMIMNNDTRIDPQAMTELVATAAKYQDNCVVTGKVYFFDEPRRLQTVGNTIDTRTLAGVRLGFGEIDEGQYDREIEREMIDDIFMLLPARIYRKIGGYSTYFYLNYEQTDLIFRIKKDGYKAIYTPAAKLWHKGSFSSGGLGNPYMMFWEGKSSIILHRLYQNRWDFILFYCRFGFSNIYILGKGLLGTALGKTKNLRSRYAMFRGFLSGTFWLFQRREESGRNPFAVK
jgi:GT2 family glycosyltransferase